LIRVNYSRYPTDAPIIVGAYLQAMLLLSDTQGKGIARERAPTDGVWGRRTTTARHRRTHRRVAQLHNKSRDGIYRL